MPYSANSEAREEKTGSLPLSFDDVTAAAARIGEHAVKTPLLESPLLNERLGGRLLLKAECLQKTGSFKFRGALNALLQIPEADRARGVIAFSSGNHAQGVAAAARILGLPATIVMPADAPKLKTANTKAWGANVVPYDRFGESREEIGAAIQAETGATLVKPYDDLKVMAGQGTAALEALAQARDMGAERVDLFLVCCGGGGLTAGCATAVRALSPATEVCAVEPEAFDDTARSLASGRFESVAPDARSICDALLTPTPGDLTFAVNRRLLKGAYRISDQEALDAMATLFTYFKVVAEPGGAAAAAAVISGKVALEGRTAIATISGGNVDAEMFDRALGEGQVL